jgi:hypothetical protein
MKRMMLLVALGANFAAAQAYAAPMGFHRGPPDTFTHVPTMCVLPKGGFCNTGPMVRLGERCFCDGPQGRRYGEVRQK